MFLAIGAEIGSSGVSNFLLVASLFTMLMLASRFFPFFFFLSPACFVWVRPFSWAEYVFLFRLCKGLPWPSLFKKKKKKKKIMR
jgi:hypothetical protein